MEKIETGRKKIFISLAIGALVLIGVLLACIYLFNKSKDSIEFTWNIENLSVTNQSVVSLNNKTKTITIEELQAGDKFSFDIKISNPTDVEYNYDLSIKTNINDMTISQLGAVLKHGEESKIFYGFNTMKLESSLFIKSQNNDVLSITISLSEDEEQELKKCELKLNIDKFEVEEDTPIIESDIVVASDEEGLIEAIEGGKIIFLSNKDGGYLFDEDIVVTNEVVIYGQSGETPSLNGSFVIESGAKIEMQNIVMNGHIETTKVEQQNPNGSNENNESIITLNNVKIIGSEERINKTGILESNENDDTKPALLIESDTKLQIVGNVEVVGNWDASAIGVHKDAKLIISGDNLTAIGNGGYEVLPTDKEYYQTKEQAQTLSADSEFSSHLANDFNQISNPEAFVELGGAILNKYDLNGKGGGSGIGEIYMDDSVGSIKITNLKSLIAEGYGYHAFGVGGIVVSDIVVENTTIKRARGGFAINEITVYDAYYWANGIIEGGSAIGTYESGTYNNGVDETGKPNYPGVILDNVNIMEAYGGHKAAGIGGTFWTPTKVIITNSIIENVWGGTYGAGIGGSKIHETADQPTYVEIINSKISVTGGDYAAGIGSSSCNGCRRADDSLNRDGYPQLPLTTINIRGNSEISAVGGIGGAGIGTGHNGGRLEGIIEENVNTTGTKSGGFGEIERIRGKKTTYNNETVYVYSYKFCEFAASGNLFRYYVPVSDETKTSQAELLEIGFVGEMLITKPEDIGLGALGGNWVTSSSAIVALGLADINKSTGELKNTETVERAIEIYRAGGSKPEITDEIASTLTTMQEFIDYVYNIPKGYVSGSENYHVYDPNNTYYATSKLVDRRS
ncbi:MAG: hypothetical protein IJ415_02150 [Clostridia bacterium]|nr:hypothetical protein [Clostridia bacterium]